MLMATQPNILIVEDDTEIRELVAAYLRDHGFAVTEAIDGKTLDAALARDGMPDLLILDVMMPGEDGLSICRRLRARSGVPILMLTARAEDIDRIVGLELGADDYLAKPFNPRELLARIRAILRRGERQRESDGERIRVDHLLVNVARREVVLAASQTALDLTSAEFDLLECFVRHPGRVLSRDQLMDWTRGRTADAFDRTIDVQVSRLRKKIETEETTLIKTVRNHGYLLIATVVEV